LGLSVVIDRVFECPSGLGVLAVVALRPDFSQERHEAASRTDPDSVRSASGR
jgi:hypothetical protein